MGSRIQGLRYSNPGLGFGVLSFELCEFWVLGLGDLCFWFWILCFVSCVLCVGT
jgi:hypothetical protein